MIDIRHSFVGKTPWWSMFGRLAKGPKGKIQQDDLPIQEIDFHFFTVSQRVMLITPIIDNKKSLEVIQWLMMLGVKCHQGLKWLLTLSLSLSLSLSNINKHKSTNIPTEVPILSIFWDKRLVYEILTHGIFWRFGPIPKPFFLANHPQNYHFNTETNNNSEVDHEWTALS